MSLLVLKTGLTPSASGSAYLELEHSTSPGVGIKLSCTVHGPRPLPRFAPFTSHVLLSTYVKFAPFATYQRRGYVQDASERDLAIHLENALRGVIIAERWPKSGLDIIVTVLEGEDDSAWSTREAFAGETVGGGWGAMSVLSCCITVASAAIADAGIDCIDFVCGGMAVAVRHLHMTTNRQSLRHSEIDPDAQIELILNPCPSENQELVAACVVGYVQSRDEITEIWIKGSQLNSIADQNSSTSGFGLLLDRSVEAAMATRLVLIDAINESTHQKLQILNTHKK